MLFAGIILGAVGYTLMYAGIKGDKYTLGGQPVWRRPWLPFIAVFSSGLRSTETAATVTSGDSSYLTDLLAGLNASGQQQGNASPNLSGTPQGGPVA